MARIGASTCTINSTTIGAISGSGSGRMCLAIHLDAPAYQKNRFHVPGTDGNIVIYNGRVGQRLMVAILYKGNLSDILGYYEDDSNDWANLPVDIVDDSGTTYTRCNLESFTREKPVGISADEAMFTATAVFTIDS